MNGKQTKGKKGTSGVKYITLNHLGKYLVKPYINGKVLYYGEFDTLDEAKAALKNAMNGATYSNRPSGRTAASGHKYIHKTKSDGVVKYTVEPYINGRQKYLGHFGTLAEAKAALDQVLVREPEINTTDKIDLKSNIVRVRRNIDHIILKNKPDYYRVSVNIRDNSRSGHSKVVGKAKTMYEALEIRNKIESEYRRKPEQDEINLREKYDEKRVDGVAMPLFKGKEPRKDSSTGYRGVQKYYTRVSQEERYRAWITVKGKTHYKSGFVTPSEAYYNGRLRLEKEFLP